MFEKITKRLNESLPSIRRPQDQNHFNKFLSDYGFIFENNKLNGGFNRYYNAFQNPYVFQCIETQINVLRNCGFSINTRNEDVPNIDERVYLENLFNQPQGFTSDYSYNLLIGQIIRSLELTGDVFIEVNNDYNFGKINGFKYIPPTLLDWSNENDCYYYRENPSIQYENSELIHIFEPHPLDPHHQHFGVSKVDNIVTQIKLILGILDYNYDIVNNDGLSPKAILSFDKDISDFSFNSELERLSQISDSKKKGGTLAIRGASFQAPPINENTNWLDLMNQCRDTILSNYGIPPIYLGIVETANLGTGTGESQKEVFKNLLDGKKKLIEDGFNKALGRNGFQEIFEINDWDIEDKLRRVQIESQKVTNGIMTINEVRKGYNLEPVSWGDNPNSMKSENEELMLSEFQAYKTAYYSDRFNTY